MALEQSWGEVEVRLFRGHLRISAYLDTGSGGLGGDLEVAHPTLGEHHRRVGVDLDGFGEQADGFFPFTLSEENLLKPI